MQWLIARHQSIVPVQVPQASGLQDMPDALDEFVEDESLLKPVTPAIAAPRRSSSQLRSSGSPQLARCGFSICKDKH